MKLEKSEINYEQIYKMSNLGPSNVTSEYFRLKMSIIHPVSLSMIQQVTRNAQSCSYVDSLLYFWGYLVGTDLSCTIFAVLSLTWLIGHLI